VQLERSGQLKNPMTSSELDLNWSSNSGIQGSGQWQVPANKIMSSSIGRRKYFDCFDCQDNAVGIDTGYMLSD
jgi:hypothetical protein